VSVGVIVLNEGPYDDGVRAVRRLHLRPVQGGGDLKDFHLHHGKARRSASGVPRTTVAVDRSCDPARRTRPARCSPRAAASASGGEGGTRPDRDGPAAHRVLRRSRGALVGIDAHRRGPARGVGTGRPCSRLTRRVCRPFTCHEGTTNTGISASINTSTIGPSPRAIANTGEVASDQTLRHRRQRPASRATSNLSSTFRPRGYSGRI